MLFLKEKGCYVWLVQLERELERWDNLRINSILSESPTIITLFSVWYNFTLTSSPVIARENAA